MELKVGSKHTDLGFIPEDWVIKYIGEISEVKTGPFGSALHEKDYVDNGTPIITVEHLGHYGVEHVNLPMVSDEDKSRLKSYVLLEGDIVFSRVGSIDRNALIKVAEVGWLFSGRLLRIRISNYEADSKYLSYYFHFEPFKQRIRSVAVGQTMPSLNTAILKGIKVVLPTKNEQTAIAKALSDADAWIQSLIQLIAKKRQIKQGAMQALLNPYENGKFKDGWVKVKLGDIASFMKGKGLPKSHMSPNGKFKCIHYGELFTLYKEFITNVKSRTDFNDSTCFSRANDILMPTSDVTPNGLATASCMTEDRVILGGDILIIRPQENTLNGIFFSYLINIMREQVMQLVTGSTVYHLYGTDMAKLELLMPNDLREQINIANTLMDMDKEIIELENKLNKAKQIKQGIMQNLLTGRIRLI